MESKRFHHISLTKYIVSFSSKMIAFHQNVSENSDSAHTEVEDLCARCMNGSDVYDRCGHDTILLHPSCTARRKTANLSGQA